MTRRRGGVTGSTEGISILYMSSGTGRSGESPGCVLSRAAASSQARRIAVNRSSSVDGRLPSSVDGGNGDGLLALLASLLPPGDSVIGISVLPAKAQVVMCHLCPAPTSQRTPPGGRSPRDVPP